MSAKSKVPTTTVKVSPTESVFEVAFNDGKNTLWGDDYFKFSISADGIVSINDNVFNSKEQAAKVLEAMAAFLKK